MNIFFLDKDQYKAAEYHHDIHLNKMILETAQLLSTAHHVLDGENARSDIYKKTHVNHPMAVWVRQDYYNYMWAHDLLVGLIIEYVVRKDKIHASSKLLKPLGIVPKNIKYGDMTIPPLCMPDEYKVSPVTSFDDVVESYRKYYIHAKQVNKNGKNMATWTKRQQPYWFNKEI